MHALALLLCQEGGTFFGTNEKLFGIAVVSRRRKSFGTNESK
jgi:hypothetical protein